MTKTWPPTPRQEYSGGSQKCQTPRSRTPMPPDNLVREIGVAVAHRRATSLPGALQAAKRIFENGTQANKEAIILLVADGLDYLATELSYDCNHENPDDVPLLRLLCTELAVAIAKDESNQHPAVVRLVGNRPKVTHCRKSATRPMSVTDQRPTTPAAVVCNSNGTWAYRNEPVPNQRRRRRLPATERPVRSRDAPNSHATAARAATGPAAGISIARPLRASHAHRRRPTGRHFSTRTTLPRPARPHGHPGSTAQRRRANRRWRSRRTTRVRRQAGLYAFLEK